MTQIITAVYYEEVAQRIPEHVLRKIHHYTFGRKISGRTFFRILPQNCTFFLSKFWWPFFSHRPFYDFYSLPCLTDWPSFLFLNSTFSPQKFLDDLFRILPLNLTFYLSKIPMTFFSHCAFLPFFTVLCITDDDSYFLFLHTIHPLTPSRSAL